MRWSFHDTRNESIAILECQLRMRLPNAFTSFVNLVSISGAGCGAYLSRM